jgi:transposase InsO family protein
VIDTPAFYRCRAGPTRPRLSSAGALFCPGLPGGCGLRDLPATEEGPELRLHQNARTCSASRRLMCERIMSGWSVRAAAEAGGISDRRAREWRRRWEAGDRDLEDRSSVAGSIPGTTPRDVEEAVCALRELRFSGVRIAEARGMPERTVRAVLARNGLSRLPRLDAAEPQNRYERPMPGELIRIDVKKLGRIGREGHRIHGDRRRRSPGIGWEFVHVAIDDCTRLAYVQVLDDERRDTVIAFLKAAVSFFESHGIEVQRLMTDNDSAYRSHAHAAACRLLAIPHLRTQPYRPRTNGKAERFIRTLQAEWAYGAAYPTSAARTRTLPAFIDRYKHRRPHNALNGSTPIQRLTERLNAPAAYT